MWYGVTIVNANRAQWHWHACWSPWWRHPESQTMSAVTPTPPADVQHSDSSSWAWPIAGHLVPIRPTHRCRHHPGRAQILVALHQPHYPFGANLNLRLGHILQHNLIDIAGREFNLCQWEGRLLHHLTHQCFSLPRWKKVLVYCILYIYYTLNQLFTR